jgi:hypothetical protein
VNREPARSFFAPEPSNLNHLPTALRATWSDEACQLRARDRASEGTYRIVELLKRTTQRRHDDEAVRLGTQERRDWGII